VLIGTVIFLSLIVILLAVPVTLTYQLSWRQTLAAKVRLIWAFGLVRADVSPGDADDKPDKPKAERRKKSKNRRTNAVAAMREPSFRRRMRRFAADLWCAIHKHNVRLRVRLGLGDPADTGQLWALLGPISGMLARLRDIRVVIEPDFLDPTLDVDSSGTIRVVPLRIVGIVLGLFVSPPFWRGMLAARSAR
jgi:hypothetical protein